MDGLTAGAAVFGATWVLVTIGVCGAVWQNGFRRGRRFAWRTTVLDSGVWADLVSSVWTEHASLEIDHCRDELPSSVTAVFGDRRFRIEPREQFGKLKVHMRELLDEAS